MSHPVLSESLLAQPAALAVRTIANARLDVCADALDRLDDGGPEALHDLRVSLRRLRTWFRNFRPYLDDTVRWKRIRRLRDLVHATNDARDREVWIAWIGEQTDLPARARSGMRYFTQYLVDERETLNRGSLADMRDRLPGILAKLREDVATYTCRLDDRQMDSMAEATTDVMRTGLARLHRRIEAVKSENDVSGIHATRITAKRLRYVVETLEPRRPAGQAVEQLTALQDQLGTVHDMHLLIGRLLTDVESAAAADARKRTFRAIGLEDGDPDDRPPHRAIAGLTELARRATQHAHQHYSQFATSWNPDKLEEQIKTLSTRR